MKKIVSIILAVLMVFSITATVAFAADDVKITFTDERGYVLKEITVDFGENYTSRAPEDTTIDGGYKTYVSGWETDHIAFKGTVYEGQLPIISEKDGITEVTFKAAYTTVEYTPENVIGGVVDGIFGENTTNLFSSFIQLIKEFFQQFLMFLMNFGF